MHRRTAHFVLAQAMAEYHSESEETVANSVEERSLSPDKTQVLADHFNQLYQDLNSSSEEKLEPEEEESILEPLFDIGDKVNLFDCPVQGRSLWKVFGRFVVKITKHGITSRAHIEHIEIPSPQPLTELDTSSTMQKGWWYGVGLCGSRSESNFRAILWIPEAFVSFNTGEDTDDEGDDVAEDNDADEDDDGDEDNDEDEDNNMGEDDDEDNEFDRSDDEDYEDE